MKELHGWGWGPTRVRKGMSGNQWHAPSVHCKWHVPHPCSVISFRQLDSDQGENTEITENSDTTNHSTLFSTPSIPALGLIIDNLPAYQRLDTLICSTVILPHNVPCWRIRWSGEGMMLANPSICTIKSRSILEFSTHHNSNLRFQLLQRSYNTPPRLFLFTDSHNSNHLWLRHAYLNLLLIFKSIPSSWSTSPAKVRPWLVPLLPLSSLPHIQRTFKYPQNTEGHFILHPLLLPLPGELWTMLIFWIRVQGCPKIVFLVLFPPQYLPWPLWCLVFTDQPLPVNKALAKNRCWVNRIFIRQIKKLKWTKV